MKRLTVPLALLTLALATPAALRAEETAPAAAVESAAQPAAPKTFVERLAEKGVKVTQGPAKVALGTVAEYQLLEGQVFIGPDSLERYCQLTQNPYSKNDVGIVIAPAWMLFFRYDDVGHVKDDEKEELDARKLLASLQEGQEAANEARKQRGWHEMKVQGWAKEPYYDEKTNNLKWAIKLTSSQDNHQTPWINEEVRLLGRGGIMNVTLACDTEVFAQAVQESDTLLASNFAYVAGQKYAEWRSGDKVAAYGLSALVLGGGAAVAAKMGFFAKLGSYFAKFAKVIVIGVVAVGAGIAKFFRRLTGSRPADES